MMVTNQNPHLMFQGSSWKFKRANLAVAHTNLQL